MLGGKLGALLAGAGTLPGMIVGGVIGACFGVGMGAVLGKQFMRMFSWMNVAVKDGKIQNRLPYINRTNPDKYSVDISKGFCRELPADTVYESAPVDIISRGVRSVTNEQGHTFYATELHTILKKLYLQKKIIKGQISTWAHISSWLGFGEDKDNMSRK